MDKDKVTVSKGRLKLRKTIQPIQIGMVGIIRQTILIKDQITTQYRAKIMLMYKAKVRVRVRATTKVPSTYQLLRFKTKLLMPEEIGVVKAQLRGLSLNNRIRFVSAR